MELTKSPERIYKYLEQIENDQFELGFTISQKRYLFDFLKKNKTLVWKLSFLILCDLIFQLFVFLSLKKFIVVNFSYMNKEMFWVHTIIALCLIVLYLFFTVYKIKKINYFILGNINELRVYLFSSFLNNMSKAPHGNYFSSFFVKQMYYVHLLNLGLKNVLLNIIKYLAILAVTVVLAFVFAAEYLFILFLTLITSGIILVIGNMIGRHYIAREKTFNTLMISHLIKAKDNFLTLLNQGSQSKFLAIYKKYLNLDLYFRVRRNTWIEASASSIGVMLLLVSTLYFIITTYFPQFNLIQDTSSMVNTGLITFYCSMLLYLSIRIGLFYEVFWLGLKIAIPEYYIRDKKTKINKFNEIEFYSKRIKVSNIGNYINRFNISLSKNTSTIICGESNLGKTTIARLMAGTFLHQAFKVKVDNKRIISSHWSGNNLSYFITPSFQSNSSLSEFLFGNYFSSVSKRELERLIDILKTPQLKSVFKSINLTISKSSFTSFHLNGESISFTDRFSLQLLYCLIHETKLIIIDNQFLDASNSDINQAVQHIIKEKKTTLVIFSTKNINLGCDEKYKLDNMSCKKII